MSKTAFLKKNKARVKPDHLFIRKAYNEVTAFYERLSVMRLLLKKRFLIDLIVFPATLIIALIIVKYNIGGKHLLGIPILSFFAIPILLDIGVNKPINKFKLKFKSDEIRLYSLCIAPSELPKNLRKNLESIEKTPKNELPNLSQKTNAVEDLMKALKKAQNLIDRLLGSKSFFDTFGDGAKFIGNLSKLSIK